MYNIVIFSVTLTRVIKEWIYHGAGYNLAGAGLRNSPAQTSSSMQQSPVFSVITEIEMLHEMTKSQLIKKNVELEIQSDKICIVQNKTGMVIAKTAIWIELN